MIGRGFKDKLLFARGSGGVAADLMKLRQAAVAPALRIIRGIVRPDFQRPDQGGLDGVLADAKSAPRRTSAPTTPGICSRNGVKSIAGTR